MFPNPVHNILNLDISGVDNNPLIIIYSMYGNVVLQQQLTNKLDVSSLAIGMYYIKIGSKVGKFVKL